MLYLLPTQPSSSRRGAPRKYGEKLNITKATTLLPLQQASIKAYGKTRCFEFYIAQAKVRFLKGHICRVVWCRFQQDSGKWTNWALLLATEPAETINGRVNMDVYAPGRELQDLGVLGTQSDMHPETAFIKTAWLLSNYQPGEAKELFMKNLRGELSVRTVE